MKDPIKLAYAFPVWWIWTDQIVTALFVYAPIHVSAEEDNG